MIIVMDVDNNHSVELEEMVNLITSANPEVEGAASAAIIKVKNILLGLDKDGQKNEII